MSHISFSLFVSSDPVCAQSPTATDKETKLTCFQILTVGRNKNPSPDIVPGCAGIVPRAGTEVGYCAFVPGKTQKSSEETTHSPTFFS